MKQYEPLTRKDQQPVRYLIVDDSVFARKSLVKMVESFGGLVAGEAGDGCAAVVGPGQAGDHAQRGGFARAVAAEEPGDGSGFAVEGHAVDRDDVSVALGKAGGGNHGFRLAGRRGAAHRRRG